MKECKYCGTQYADHLTTCPSCGANVVVSEKDKIIADAHNEQEIAMVKEQLETKKKLERPKMAPGKKILITMLGTVAVLAIIIIATTALNNRPVTADGKTNSDLKQEYKKAMESMELENYEQAIAEFNAISSDYKDYDKVVKQREKAVEAYREQVLEQAASYVATGKFEDALSLLTLAMETYGENKELSQRREEILYGYKQDIFAEAEQYAGTGDYSTAIKRLEMFLTVIGTDAEVEMKMQYYKKAQILKQVQVYESENNYASAIAYLETEMVTMGQDAELTTKLTSLISAYKTSSIEMAESYVENGSYDEAIALLEGVSKTLGADADIEMKAKVYKKEQVLKQIEVYENEKNYESAIKYLNTKIATLGQDTELTTKLAGLRSAYKAAGMEDAKQFVDAGDYDTAVGVLQDLLKLLGSDEEINRRILDYKKEQSLVVAEKFVSNKNYLDGIRYLESQIKNLGTDAKLSSKLNELYSLYKDTMLSKAVGEANNNQYGTAVATLKSLRDVIGTNAEVDSKILEYRKAEISTKLADYDKSKDYAGAISYLQNDVSEAKTDAELKSKLADYISKYKKDLFAKAAAAYEANGYSAAVQLLNNDKVLKNDTEVKAKVTYYNNKKPVLLSSLEMYKNDGDFKYIAKSTEDILGNVYQEYFYSYGDYSATAIYYLNKEYEEFKCKLVIIDANLVAKKDVNITIRDDDTNEVLFSGKLDSKNTDGILVECDVSQVKFLSIELKKCNWKTAVMVNAQLIKK